MYVCTADVKGHCEAVNRHGNNRDHKVNIFFLCAPEFMRRGKYLAADTRCEWQKRVPGSGRAAGVEQILKLTLRAEENNAIFSPNKLNSNCGRMQI